MAATLLAASVATVAAESVIIFHCEDVACVPVCSSGMPCWFLPDWPPCNTHCNDDAGLRGGGG